MRYVLLLFPLILSGCFSKQECRKRAEKLQIDESVCSTHNGRQKMHWKFVEVSEKEIDDKIDGFKDSDDKKYIKALETGLVQCKEKLKQAYEQTPNSCPVPEKVEREDVGFWER